MCFEESDGISFLSHTLDKCAMAGVMMAINTLALTGKNLSEQYRDIQKKYGYFYPDKAGADVKGMLEAGVCLCFLLQLTGDLTILVLTRG